MTDFHSRETVGSIGPYTVEAGLSGYEFYNGGVVQDDRRPCIRVLGGGIYDPSTIDAAQALVLSALVEAAGKIAERLWQQRKPRLPPKLESP